MAEFTKKGNIVVKIVILALGFLLLMAVLVPRKMWEEQKQRTDLAHARMVDMADCQVIYMQEKGSFDKDLEKVYKYSVANEMVVGAPELEIEILELDTSAIRLSFTDRDHIEDLKVLTPVMTKAEKQLKKNEVVYNPVNKISFTLKNLDSKIGLKTDTVSMSSDAPIAVKAFYKGTSDIYWEVRSESKINFTINKAPVEQKVNIARYVLSDFENDKTPYLCPSTLSQFNTEFNLNAKIYMRVKFFKGDINEGLLGDKTPVKVTGNETLKNYFLNIAKLKAERMVGDMVREYELEGDSTHSSDSAKAILFSAKFKEYLTNAGNEEAVIDSISSSLSSIDTDMGKNFSEEKRFENLFASSPGENVLAEMKKAENIAELEKFNVVYSTRTGKIDTVSVKISSPITDNSEFKGVSRGFFETEAVFGVKDDVNHGYVDNGRPNWKKE